MCYTDADVEENCNHEDVLEGDESSIPEGLSDLDKSSIPESVWLILKALLEAGLEMYPFITTRRDRRLLFVLVTCTHATLNGFADDKNYQVALDPAEVMRLLRRGNSDRKWRGRVIAEGDGLNEWGPYDNIYGKWESELTNSPMTVYRGLRWKEPKTLADSATAESAKRATKDVVIMFEKGSLHRLNLLNMLIRTEKTDKGAGLQIDTLLHLKTLDAFFPMHNKKRAAVLLKACLKWTLPPWRQPFEKIKEYFGTQIALYFVFMSHYSSALVAPAVLGIGCQLVVWATGPNFSSPVLPPFGAFICVWAISMLAYWKRQETKSALMWGTTDFEASETQRPEFEGIVIRSFVDGKLTLYYPIDSQERRFRFSTTVIATLILMVIGAVAGIYVMKFVLTEPLGSNASTLASIANTVQINFFNYVYSNVARLLVENENLRTDTEFSDSLVSKLFLFQFTNSYASFFYIAFVAAYLAPTPGANPDYLGQCGYFNCMQPLAVNLGILFGTNITVNNVIRLLSNLYAHRSRGKTVIQNLEKAKKHPSQPEMEYAQLEFNNLNEMMKVYADVTIQFGFSVLFVTALPMSCFCSLLSNYATIKIHIWKMLQVSQRPVPMGAQDIGPWFGILNILAVFAVMTNAGLICFTMDVLGTDQEVHERIDLAAPAQSTFRAGFSPIGRLWIFVIFIVALLLLQFFVHLVVPPESEEVSLQKKRQELIREKLIEGVADDDWGDETSNFDEIPDMNEVEPRASFFTSGDLTACFRTNDALGDYVTIGAQLRSNDKPYMDKLRRAITIAKDYINETRASSVLKISRRTLASTNENKDLLMPAKSSFGGGKLTSTSPSSAESNDAFFPLETTLDTGAGFLVGARVEGMFRGERFFPGTILRVHPYTTSTFDVVYDENGDKETRVERHHIRLLDGGPSSSSARLEEGANVEAKTRGRSKWCKGKIVREHSEPTFDVEFDDKGIRKALVESRLRDLDRENTYADPGYIECQVVFRAMRRGKPGLDFINFLRMHGAEIKRCFSDEDIVAAIKERLQFSGTLVSSTSSDSASAMEERYMLQSQLLFADIFSMCSFGDAFRLRISGGFDQLSSYRFAHRPTC